MKREIVGSMSEWSGILKDLFRQIDDGSLTREELQEFLENRLTSNIDWAKVYEALDMSVEYAEFTKSGTKESHGLWLVPVIKGVTCKKVVDALRRLGSEVYTYVDDLDKGVPTNDRDPNRDGSYAIGFAKNVEADEENKNKSANQLKEVGHKGITLLERLLLELGYFLATGKHLDVKNVTLCAVSRYSDGSVPSVYWYSDDRAVLVYWYYPGLSSGHLRSRSAVSLPA